MVAQHDALRQQVPAASASAISPGAANVMAPPAVPPAGRAEYLVYLETLDHMAAAIGAAQNLAAAYQANPTPVGRLRYLAANDEMAVVMHRAKVQAMNLQRLRLESRLSDLNASLASSLHQGVAPAAAAAAAAAAGAGPMGGAGALPPAPNALPRQVSE